MQPKFADRDHKKHLALECKNKAAMPPDAINKSIQKDRAEIYPNPAKEMVNLTLYSNQKYTQVKICDVLGQQLYSKEISIQSENKFTLQIPIDKFSRNCLKVENEKYTQLFKLHHE